MTAKEFNAAFKIADNDSIDLSDVDNSVIVGYGLSDFKPVYVTLKMVAKEIRYHAMMMNGKWDSEAIQDVRYHARKAFIIVGEIHPEADEYNRDLKLRIAGKQVGSGMSIR